MTNDWVCGIIFCDNKAEQTESFSPPRLTKGVNKVTKPALAGIVFIMFLCTNGLFGCSCFQFLEVLTISIKELTINEEIEAKEVRVIDTDGSQLGVMATSKAIEIAYSKDLDLVCMSPNTDPVVCKIMDYGKYRFDQAKREKESRKNQKVVEMKEIRLGLATDTHDFETKGNHAVRFLKDGHKVKVSIRFRGRELGHPEIGLENMERFAQYCSEVSVVEKPAKMEGRNMLMFLAPKPTK